MATGHAKVFSNSHEFHQSTKKCALTHLGRGSISSAKRGIHNKVLDVSYCVTLPKKMLFAVCKARNMLRLELWMRLRHG